MINKPKSPSDRPSDREGEAPWDRAAIDSMPALPSVDVPNGVARPSGPGEGGAYTFVNGQFKPVDEWGGNRTGE